MPADYHIVPRACPEIAPELTGALPPLLARIYSARGISSLDQLELKLHRLLPAQQLTGLDAAVSALNEAIESQKRLLIVGDFDADGATSTALMMLALGQMGAQVDYLVPDRFKYGYGLTPEIVQLAIRDYQPELIITVDNGISSHAGVLAAQQAHIEVIITDHHLTSKQPPDCIAVVNPNQPQCDFPSKALAGVGVAFYVLAALATRRRQAGNASVAMAQYLDLVALGTVADVAVLDHNNRILVAAGVERIRQAACRPGILALLEIAGRQPDKISPQDLGFVLGPRINAAGRMDSMRIGIECLLAADFDSAWPLAQQLDSLNQARRRVEQSMQAQAQALLSQCRHPQLDPTATELPPAIVLYEPSWHQGVIGIVAGRLKEQFHRPVIVFAPGEQPEFIKGSARSIDGIHIRDTIEQVAELNPQLISHFGGHAMAAGLTLPRAHFAAFASHFSQLVACHDASLFEQTCLTDGRLQPQELSLDTLEQLRHAEPWGHGFPEPLFEGVFTLINYRWLQNKHLKMRLLHPDGQQKLDAIYFNACKAPDDTAGLTPQSRLGATVHLVYRLALNEFGGRRQLQLMVHCLNEALP